MATKQFGEKMKTASDYIAELYELAGVEFPVQMQVSLGKLINIEYQTEWKTGTTTPVEKTRKVKDPETGKPISEPFIDYVPDYTERKLTDKQIKAIDTWIEQQLKG